MNFGYIIASLFFFFNPLWNIFDIFPDFIGCLLMMKGLSKIADINSTLSSAREQFSRLLKVYFFKFLIMCFFTAFDATWILVWTFVFLILEFIYAIPAFNAFFDGMGYFDIRFSTTEKNIESNKLKSFNLIFIIAKSVLALIPEFCALSSSDLVGLSDLKMSDFRMLLTVASIVIGSIIGIIWLVQMYTYLSAVKNDKGFIERIKTQYQTEILPNKNLFLMRALISGISVISFAAFFLLFIPFDGFYIIPTFICPILLTIGLNKWKKYISAAKNAAKTSAISSIVLLLAYISGIAYSYKFSEYFNRDFANLIKMEGFIEYYVVFAALSVMGYLLFAIALWHMAKALLDIVLNHCGFSAEAFAPSGENVEKSFGKALFGSKSINRYDSMEIKALKSQLKQLFISGALLIFSSSLAIALNAIIKPIWILPFLVWIAFIVFALRLFSNLKQEIERKYL